MICEIVLYSSAVILTKGHNAHAYVHRYCIAELLSVNILTKSNLSE